MRLIVYETHGANRFYPPNKELYPFLSCSPLIFDPSLSGRSLEVATCFPVVLLFKRLQCVDDANGACDLVSRFVRDKERMDSFGLS